MGGHVTVTFCDLDVWPSAYRALQCIAAPGNDRDLKQDATNVIARLNRYPDDPEFGFGSRPGV